MVSDTNFAFLRPLGLIASGTQVAKCGWGLLTLFAETGIGTACTTFRAAVDAASGLTGASLAGVARTAVRGLTTRAHAHAEGGISLEIINA